MSLGPIMMGLQGLTLQPEEREMLQHPLVGGAILFSRNYESEEQLKALTQQLHGLRDPHLIVAVDHEGGRVQRFRAGFSAIPPMAVFGEHYRRSPRDAQQLAEQAGWLLAIELLSCGLDLSFTPVLDTADNDSVIGDRAFSKDPEVIGILAQALVRGMQRAGMSAVGKHFPGHGGVLEDSHVAMPVDQRSYEDLMMRDIVPFERLIHAGLAGIMPSHVVYQQLDSQPAGFSRYWLQDVLRGQLGFQGVIFSDDMGMKGAEWAGSNTDRVRIALEAGCDMVLLCNEPAVVVEVLDNLGEYNNPASQIRLVRMHGHFNNVPADLKKSAEWQQVSKQINELNEPGTPELDF